MSGLDKKGIYLAVWMSDGEVQVLDNLLFFGLSPFLAKVATKLFDTVFFFFLMETNGKG